MVDAHVPVLRCRHLTVPAGSVRSWRPFRGGSAAPLLLDLDLGIRPAERIWLVGALDPGVAALLGAMRGVPEATGSLRVGGSELVGASRRARARAMTQVEVWEAQPEALSSARSARDVVAAAVEAARRTNGAKGSSAQLPAAGEVAATLLEELGLADGALARPIDELPDHASWRVRFALSLVRDLQLLVTVGPLPPSAEEAGAQAVIARLREAGVAVLHLDDRLPEALGPEEAVAVVCGGQVVELLDAASVADPHHPYTRSLGSGVPSEPVLVSTSRPRGAAASGGCPFQEGCARAQERCAVMPGLAVPLGGRHPVACHFPLAGAATTGSPVSSEPTAREFAQAW